MPDFAVAAAYRFVDLPDAAELREQWFQSAQAAALKGTLLVATEGLNFTLAGEPAALEAWLAALQADARLAGLDIKRHRHDSLPFRHLRVKLKNEIIRMNQPVVRPQAARAPAVDAATLQRWLDQGGRDDAGRDVVLLDTRNGFEVDAGAFEGALDWRLAKFSDFPAALEQHREALQGKTVVSYCTGGIRCEKAALWMQQAGIEHVLQLDGGILRYFEATTGAPHWQGRCFVFDEREGLERPT
ncbi:MAG: sulfurtransferase [Rubrivivax sp.]|nr:sulfurtransferase [Rubrivivax sp.]